jgi:hypothetical protein
MLLRRLGGSLRCSGATLPRGLVLLLPVTRRFTTAGAGAAPPPPSGEAPPIREKAYVLPKAKTKKIDWKMVLESFYKRPYGIIVLTFASLGVYYIFTSLSGLWERYWQSVAEANAMNALQMEGADPAQLAMLFLHARLARAVLADEAVAHHMGTLRFQPETLKLTQLTKENKVMVTFNVYGTRRVGMVTVVLVRSSSRDGLVVYQPVEFAVDAWDGKVFDLSEQNKDYRIDFTEARDEVARRIALTQPEKKKSFF